MSVRPVRPDDVPDLVRLVRELAAYERAEHEVRLTEEQLTAALFGDSPALFGHVATAGDGAGDGTGDGTGHGTGDGAVVGLALWFLNFSTWRGTHGVYLEDLYVSPAHRGTGLGRELLRTLAAVCVERGYSRLEWSVLDWNTPSIDFYRAAGAVPMDDWTVFRLTDDALARFGGAGR
jgi:GNAT superfamily N-acetyltransferase